jgi:hypothetical protein
MSMTPMATKNCTPEPFGMTVKLKVKGKLKVLFLSNGENAEEDDDDDDEDDTPSD